MMNPEIPLSPEVAQLVRAIRFALVSLIVALSYFTIRAAEAVPKFEQIFHDMLYNRPLPTLTTFVIRIDLLLLAGAWSIPLVAVGTLFSRRFVTSFYVLGGLSILTVVLFLLMCNALSSPFLSIISSMQGG